MDRTLFSHWLFEELEGAEEKLEAGWSLPNTLHRSEALLTFEKQRVFENGWIIAGHIQDWPNIGTRHLLNVGRVPIVILRDSTGDLRAFVNLCRHRGHPLVDGESNSTGRLLVCRYHSWSYDLQGKLVRAPGLETSPQGCDKRTEDLDLTPVHLAVWRGFVFVNLSNNPSNLAADLHPADNAPQEATLSAYKVHHRETLHYTADWKRVYDNVVECYHCAGVHSQTLEKMYRSEGFHDSGWVGNCRYATAELREFPAIHHSIQLFPGNLLFFDPVVGLIIRIVPETPELTALEVTFLVGPNADPAQAENYMHLWTETLIEDRAILSAQHASLGSGALPRSRLIYGREDSVIGAQKLILNAYRQGLAAR